MVSAAYPEIPVIILTGAGSIETAVNCMKLGAFDYLIKPAEEDRIVSIAKRAIEWLEIKQSSELFNESLFSGELRNPAAFSNIVTADPKMFTIFQYIESIAMTRQPVLVTGETGVGKELIARAIHTLSQRKGDFIAENVAGIDDNIFSDTLFGHVKGAFTGADVARDGIIEKARAGTLLLDEIGDLGISSQVKLLRLLQEQEYYPVGSDNPRSADVRVVATTNRDINTLKADPSFRADLFYRLKTHHIHVPALKDRKEDLPLLVDHFLGKAAEEMGKKKPTSPESLTSLLKTYLFPGNVRELKGMVYDAASKHKSRVLSTQSFAQVISSETSIEKEKTVDSMAPFTAMNKLPTLKESSEMLIEEAMSRASGNQSVAARLLGITPSSLSRRINKK
jgi:DNA-binding NtrC family response regulator